jgi:hypothetical protein
MCQVIQFNPHDIAYIILSLAHKANLHIAFSWKRKSCSFLFLLGVFIPFSGKLSFGMASSMFGIEPEEMESLDEAKDVVGELCNMISGALKSDLCDAGLDCRASLSSSTTGSDFEVEYLNLFRHDHLMFRHENDAFMVEVGLTPGDR